MGDAGSERSKPPSLPPRCPCGFWGSSKTMNLCSKCFADFQKKQPDEDPTPSTGTSQSDLFPSEIDSDNGNTSIPPPTVNPTQQLPTDLNVASSSKDECGACTGPSHVSLSTPAKRSCDSDSQSEDDPSPTKRPRLLDDGDRPDGSSRSKQKSRRRCFRCQMKLELVQQELGSCRCEISRKRELSAEKSSKNGSDAKFEKWPYHHSNRLNDPADRRQKLPQGPHCRARCRPPRWTTT